MSAKPGISLPDAPSQQKSVVVRKPAVALEIDSCGLLQGGREILIRHGDECYRLRHTRNGKLILTK